MGCDQHLGRCGGSGWRVRARVVAWVCRAGGRLGDQWGGLALGLASAAVGMCLVRAAWPWGPQEGLRGLLRSWDPPPATVCVRTPRALPWPACHLHPQGPCRPVLCDPASPPILRQPPSCLCMVECQCPRAQQPHASLTRSVDTVLSASRQFALCGRGTEGLLRRPGLHD